MPEGASLFQTQHVIVSCLLGLLIGGLIAWRFRFPRNWWSFAICVAIAMVSPWIGPTAWLVNIMDTFVVYANLFLVSLFAAFAVSYIIRLLKRPEESTRARITKYL